MLVDANIAAEGTVQVLRIRILGARTLAVAGTGFWLGGDDSVAAIQLMAQVACGTRLGEVDENVGGGLLGGGWGVVVR